MDVVREMASHRGLELRDGTRSVSVDAARAVSVMRGVAEKNPATVFASSLPGPVAIAGFEGSSEGDVLIVHARGEALLKGYDATAIARALDEASGRASRPSSPEVHVSPPQLPVGPFPPERPRGAPAGCSCFARCLPL